MERVLVLVKDIKYVEQVEKIFKEQECVVESAENIMEAIELLNTKEYNLVIYDYKIAAGEKEVSLVEYTKNKFPNLIVVVVDETYNIKRDLRLVKKGVKKYLIKDMDEGILKEFLLYYLEYSKQKSEGRNILTSKIEEITIDLKGRVITKANVEIVLTRTELMILVAFLKNKNVVLTRKEIIEKVWGKYTDVVENGIKHRVIDTHIKKLREKAKIGSIQTVYGYGYKWVEN